LTRTPRTAHVYCGSANLSASAWGRLSLGKSGRGKAAEVVRKLTIANWECGVLLPGSIAEITSNEDDDMRKSNDMTTAVKGKGIATRQRESRLAASGKTGTSDAGAQLEVTREDTIELLGKKLDLPFSIPARRYDDGEKPWMQTGSW